MKISKNRYLQGFCIVVLLLAMVREYMGVGAVEARECVETVPQERVDTVAQACASAAVWEQGQKPHRIYSVPDFGRTFPDPNDVQLKAASRYGVQPVRNREDAEMRKKELVYVGSCPYYHVDTLFSSIPYLVPRAALLLHDIGRAFYDSLYVKGIPLHQLRVTSVLRSQEDVLKLRRRNGNATELSCHLFGTTFDISYNRYKTVEDPDGEHRRMVRNDTLKWVLSEVLRDMREQGRCYVKYEVKQACFHMTVR